MTNLYLNRDIPSPERHDLLFRGDLLIYSRRPSTEALADHAIALITETFAPLDPERAQSELSVQAFIQRVAPLKSRFTNDARTKELVRNILSSFGYDLQDTYFDVPRLRVVPHGDFLTSGVSYAYKAHRDIWYASPPAQVNWWMPVYSVTAERAMSLFPEYWTREMPNNSSEFDYGEWCRVGRRLATEQVSADTRKHPLPLERVDTGSEIRIVGNKGDLLLFSASHLHSTAPNQSGRTRFSIDFRTLSRADLRTGRGAPMMDGRATGSTLGDFLRASDFSPYMEEA
jgi:hypothetical protein